MLRDYILGAATLRAPAVWDGKATMNSGPRVTSEKPAVPTLWLDTSVLINFARMEHGGSLQPIAVQRLTRLKLFLEELVGSGKLIRQPIRKKNMLTDAWIGKSMPSFSACRSECIYAIWQGIFDSQAQIGMKAIYVQGADSISLPLSTYFHSDPVQELSTARNRSIVIGANLLKDPEILERRAAAKAEVQRVWETLRQEFVAENRAYDRQLQEEHSGYFGRVWSTRFWNSSKSLRLGLPQIFGNLWL